VCGIPPVRDNIIRPLIYCLRQEIEGYCKENSLSFVTDSTNLCDEYTRNKIRHNVLPVLCDVNSSAVSNITHLSESARDVYEFLLIEAQNALDKALITENTYDAAYLKSLNKAVLNEVIVIAYSRFSCNSLDRDKINLISELITNGGRIQLYRNETVEVVKGQLRFFSLQQTKTEQNAINISLTGEYSFGEYLVNISKFNECSKNINRNVLDNLIDCDKINGKLFLRTRKEGDKFDLYKRNVSKSLKKLFCELNIPVEKRDEIPVICDDGGVVWIYSVGTSARCHITDSSSNIIYVRGENNG
jgi:tRNA(Ile)-lysidine synthase